MVQLNFPNYHFKISQNDGRHYIFDELRKKHLILTPEEWVRQHAMMYLIQELAYPKGLISIEGGIKVNTLSRRYDAVIYSKQMDIIMLVECKAPQVKITQKTFDQALAYNLTAKAEYILITNGIQHFCIQQENDKSWKFLEGIPAYSLL